MNERVLVLAMPGPGTGQAHVEQDAVGEGFVFEHLAVPVAGHVPLRLLRYCDALICHGPQPLPAWMAGLMDHCRIVVRSAHGLADIDLRAFGACGIPVCCVPSAADESDQAPICAEERRAKAARTVALFLRDGFLRDCVNASALRLASMRTRPHPGSTTPAWAGA
jgi:hypothetical protein